MTSCDHIRKLRIIHFNDCYNIDEQLDEPKGGATRFLTALLNNVDENTVVLFSGDILSPSIMSTVTKGLHMAPVLNLSQTECAVFGNHEFDFGLSNLAQFCRETKFPWLMSNVIDKETNLPLGNGELFHIIERNNVKIGLIGIVEKEWLSTLATLASDDLIFLDYVSESQKLARLLRDDYNCDIIVALTHMRFKNDIELAKNVDEIDLFLGGHDHDYCSMKVNNKYILKSGSDFKELSTLDLEVNLSTKKIDKIDIRKIEVISTVFSENEELKKELDKYKHLIESRLDQELIKFDVDLEGRFAKIRTQETNLGNFITDVIIAATKSDCVILNSGTLRSDTIHKAGPLKLRELFRILPAQYPMIVLSVTGHTIWQALENGVSQYPKFEGRFPQVSGIRFAFDPNKSPGQRVDPQFIKIGDDYLDFNQQYRLGTKVYLSKGRDGYECLTGSKVLVNEEECPDLLCTVQNYFESINRILKGDVCTHHRLSIIDHKPIYRKFSVGYNRPDHNMNVESNGGQSLIDEIAFAKAKLSPRVEGRIIRITGEEMLEQLKSERNVYLSTLST